MKTNFTITDRIQCANFPDLFLEFSDTEDGYAVRIVDKNDRKGEWNSNYRAFTVFDCYRYGSDYWGGSEIPSEIVFKISLTP